MSDIWHIPPQTPDVFKSHPIIVVYEAGDKIEQMDSKEYSDLVGERYVNRWCYVDELIKENDRTRNALDVAVDALKFYSDKPGNWLYGEFQGDYDENPGEKATEVLEQITAEQKDK